MNLDTKFYQMDSSAGGLGWEYESDEVHIFGPKLMIFCMLAHMSLNTANLSKDIQKIT